MKRRLSERRSGTCGMLSLGPPPERRIIKAVLECVVNVSEGRDPLVLERLRHAGSPHLLDMHSDRYHHRSVLTLAGPHVEDSLHEVAKTAVELIDITEHAGAHPRIGVVDVVPFVPLGGLHQMPEAMESRNRLADWAAGHLGIPCFVYGPERRLPAVRRRACCD